MARGAEGKLRRRNNRKNNKDEDVIDMFGPQDGEGTTLDTDEIPLPPSLQQKEAAEDEEPPQDPSMPKKKKKKRSTTGATTGSAPAAPSGGGGVNIKRGPLILLVLMTGTTLLPALLYAGDYLSAFLAKNDVLGSIGFRLGIGSVPKQRVLSFYEKHAPEKVEDVPSILAKHYGDYPKLIKRLERKYQDYGYFLGWEEDEAPMKLALEQVRETYDDFVVQYWNRYAPQFLKTAFRNIRYNLTFLYKKVRKVWKKQVWPILEPYLGIPDEREAAKQKRKDAADARKRKPSGSARRKNTDFRDDEDEE